MSHRISCSEGTTLPGGAARKMCPICNGQLSVTADSAVQEELDCRRCGACYASLKGTSTYEVVLPGVDCPECGAHEVQGYALVVRPDSEHSQLEKDDFVFQCPQTGRLQDVMFGERGVEVKLL